MATFHRDDRWPTPLRQATDWLAQRTRSHRWIACLAVSCAVGLTVAVTAAEPDWRNAEEMRRALETPLGITWSSRPLREALGNLATSQRVAIWLDRRIDPTLEPQFSFEKTPLLLILQHIARPLECQIGYVGPVVYIGPASVAGKLWTITELRQEEARQLPPELRNRWIARRPIQWPELSTPRELLQAAADEAGCTLEGLDAIPHDLWAAANYPPLTLPERLGLLLAGFDRTFELAAGGRSIRLTPLPDHPILQREYSPRTEPTRIPSLVADLARQFPQAAIQRSGSRLRVAGLAEDHDAISRLLRGEPVRRPAPGPAETRYSLTVKNQPFGAVLRELQLKAQIQVSVADNAQDKLRALVSFEVKEATLEQLLQAATKEAGLKFQLQEMQLSITLDEQ